MKWKTKVSIILTIVLLVTCIGVDGCNKEDNLYIYLVRHGQTYSNVKGMLVGGDGNYDLTEKGMADAISLGGHLQKESFDAVYSSTLGRAYDTANYILQGANQKNLEVVSMEGLKDISWGDAEGYTAEEFVKEYKLKEFPDAFGDANDENFVSPIHAESKYDFCNRFEKSLETISKKHEKTGGNVLVVAHSSMSFWLQKYFPNENLGELENTSVTVLKYSHGKWELLEYNKKY